MTRHQRHHREVYAQIFGGDVVDDDARSMVATSISVERREHCTMGGGAASHGGGASGVDRNLNDSRIPPPTLSRLDGEGVAVAELLPAPCSEGQGYLGWLGDRWVTRA